MKKVPLLFLVIILIESVSFAQNTEQGKWKVYTAAYNFQTICVIKDELWVGHEGGISVLNKNGELQRTITKENSGLPTNKVSHICVDSSGVIWIGTPLGLVKYDGSEWLQFYNKNSPLQANNITALAIDKQSRIWVGTDIYYGITANLFCIENGNWKTYDYTTYKISSSVIRNIIVSSENKIWIGYWLSLFEKIDNTTFKQHDISLLRGGDYFSINNYAIDSEDDIWIAASDGPIAEYTHNGQWNLWDETNSPIVHWPKKVFLDKNDNPWVGTNDYGYYIFQNSEWMNYNNNNIGQNGNAINTFYDNGNGTNFIGCKKDFLKFDQSDWGKLKLSNSGLITNNCQLIEVSDSGTVYIVNSNKLISKSSSNNWDTLLTISGTPYDMVLDFNNNLWIASISTGGGLNIFNTITKENRYFNSVNSSLTTSNISCIEIGKNGNIWIGTYGAGVYLINSIDDLTNGNALTQFNEKNSPLPHDAVNTIEINELSGEVWFGCNWYGWAKFDGSNWTVNEPFFSNQFNSIVADPSGRIWLATDKFLFSCLAGSWKEEIYEVIDKITLDVDGNIWAARNEHIYKYNDGSFTDLNVRFYPFSETINDIKVDKYNNLWIAGKGISVLQNDNPSSVSKNRSNLPVTFNLSQNYPNPFNPSTIISYTISKETHPSIPSREGKERSDRGVLVTIKVYDVLGKEVVTLVNKEQPAGSYKVEFDGSSLPSGVYFYRLQSGSFVETKKMVVMR